jgi:hypothetical protein
MFRVLGPSLLLWGILMTPNLVQAQTLTDSQTLSVSPTLFEMKANPEQNWDSELRIVNVNNYELVVYPQVVNFAPLGESGRGDLIPVFSGETSEQTLAEWIAIESGPLIIPAQQTLTVPFTVTVPAGAAPGGHYAAILVGTKPPEVTDSVSQVQTAQFVTSLFFLRVAGDVIENGTIREFRAVPAIVQESTANFEVRFENKGNVHLQPSGDISIYNMWGDKRGVVPINQQTQFGNVLPNSIRQFNFTWKGDTSPFDIGRYKAIATLGYGDEATQFTTSVTYFWVVPYKMILFTLLGIGALGWFVSWLVRMYVRRMLVLSGVSTHKTPYISPRLKDGDDMTGTVVLTRYANISAPVRAGVNDLTTRLHEVSSWRAKVRTILAFVIQYRYFFIGVIGLLLIVCALFVIVRGVGLDETSYEVTVDRSGALVTMSDEEIRYNELKNAVTSLLPPAHDQTYTLHVTNVSGVRGFGAKVRLSLEQAAYRVDALASNLDRNEKRTVIVYPPQLETEAIALSRVLDDALLSALPNETTTTMIEVFVGSDISDELVD